MPYLLNTPADVREMLARIGADSIDELFAPIPSELRMKRPLAIPPGMDELTLSEHIGALAKRNQPAGEALCFLGGGAYDHFIPSVVDVVAGRSENYTAYTPYQAEASQGTLQCVFEYQTLMCQLTGLDVANASLYEGASAVAEAVLMALGITGKTGDVLIAESVNPEYRQTLITYMANLNCRVRVLPTPNGVLNPEDIASAVNDDTVAVVAQSPNYFGHIEDMSGIAAAKGGSIFIAAFDPVSLGMLKKPADYGADIAVAEGQGLGVPLGYGGPYLGILACRKDYVRKIPGRLVGQTVDREGKRCWVLTLQAREQHIARNRATSNICTNQSLLALRATVHLAALGPHGLKETADLCYQKAHYAAAELCKLPGISMKFAAPFFKEFTLSVPGDVESLLQKLRGRNIHAGLATGPGMLTVAVTEKRTKSEIDTLVREVKAAL